MSSARKVTDSYKQVKKTQKPTAIKKDDAVPSTSAQHLLPDANPDLETLKQFDLCLDYGPCIGITRLERWERAQKHGLNPPARVRELLLKHPSDVTYTQSLWKDYNI
ncbi:DNA polymerase delta subunit 4-like [Babylonia areolata]|uniref:DNA polymerase delta subunit 4-like n=1 Tax=Babylonia areolata TaxID=304850 RepID=UPI003FD5CDF0